MQIPGGSIRDEPPPPDQEAYLESGQRQVRVDASSGAVFQNIQFQLGSSEFTGSHTYSQLAEIAEAMRSVENERFLIEGHTCDIGDEYDNLQLSTRRAMAVRNALVGMGVPPQRLQIMGFGEEDPAVVNRDEYARSQNRRVQIYRELQH